MLTSTGLLLNELGLIYKRFKFPIFRESQPDRSGFQFRRQVKRGRVHAQGFEYVLLTVFFFFFWTIKYICATSC